MIESEEEEVGEQGPVYESLEEVDLRERRKRLRELVKIARQPESVVQPLTEMEPERLDVLFRNCATVQALAGVEPQIFDRLVAMEPEELRRVVAQAGDLIVFAGVRPDALERILEAFSSDDQAKSAEVQQFRRLHKLLGRLSGAKAELLARVDRERLPDLLFRELEWASQRRASLIRWLIFGIIVGLVTLASYPWVQHLGGQP